MSGGGSLFLGIDIGTTLTKAGVVDESGSELCHEAVPTRWRTLASGADIAPEDLFAGVLSAAGRALASCRPGEIAGVGITSVAETVVLLDARGAAIGRMPAWYDKRALEDYAAYQADLGHDTIAALTGLGTAQIPTLPTLRHRLRTEAATRAVAHALSVAEWVAFRLGGELASEASLASRTGALDVARRAWWGDALAWAGAPADLFPPVRSAGTLFGRVRADIDPLARAAGAAITVAGHDHLCAAVGIGATGPETAMDSCGTAEALLRAVPIDPQRPLGAGLPLGIQTGCHALAGFDSLLGGMALGLELTPVLELLGVTSAGGRTPLDAAALGLDAGPDAAVTTATPAEGVALARAALAAGASPAQVWRDALERTVRRSHALVEGLAALGGPIAAVRLSGGWSNNPVLRRLKAACFPPLSVALVAEAGVRGAALFAGLASGRFAAPGDFPPAPVGPVEDEAAAADPPAPQTTGR